MENYEKKYKEALEWAKSIYPHTFNVDKKDVEEVSSNSQNQKMRKAMLKLLKKIESTVSDCNTLSDIITCLKKEDEKAVDTAWKICNFIYEWKIGKFGEIGLQKALLNFKF